VTRTACARPTARTRTSSTGSRSAGSVTVAPPRTSSRRCSVDHARRRAVRPVLPVAGEQLAELAGGDRGFDEATMNAWSVEEALRRLSEEHRVALVETYLRGRPYAEVAGELGIPVGTLRSRVFYGLKALRLVLDEMGVQL
jgi:RNA polymerase sigma-70 factor, ECF subfamily